jgi:hypothetical protein
MKKIITLTGLTLALILPGSLIAQEATDSSDSLTEKIKERLQETAETGLESIQDELTSQSQSPRKKAFIGYIKTIEDPLITLEYKDQTQQIEVTDDTDYSKTSLAKLEVDDFVIAMGFLYPDKQALTTHRLSFIADPQTPVSRQLITGKVKEVDGNKVAVDGKTLVISSKTTDLAIKDVEDATVEDLELEDDLFAIVTLDKNGDIDKVKTVLVIPGKYNPASQEPTNIDATESAETPDETSEDTESTEEE